MTENTKVIDDEPFPEARSAWPRIGTSGQFHGSAMMVQAIERGREMQPHIDDLTEVPNDREDYRRRIVTALKSPLTRDILDGIIAAKSVEEVSLNPDLLSQVYFRCLSADDWEELEKVEGIVLESTLWLIRMEMVQFAGKTGTAVVVPMLISALNDIESFAIDALKNLGPVAIDSVSALCDFIESDVVQPHNASVPDVPNRFALCCV